ncbi:hypothetical protein HDV00_002075 [Rhizophlyctis rosea]|nr:hypothetical protein HDV00_002075 [Rhizophlyctis rosea]
MTTLDVTQLQGKVRGGDEVVLMGEGTRSVRQVAEEAEVEIQAVLLEIGARNVGRKAYRGVSYPAYPPPPEHLALDTHHSLSHRIEDDMNTVAPDSPTFEAAATTLQLQPVNESDTNSQSASSHLVTSYTHPGGSYFDVAISNLDSTEPKSIIKVPISVTNATSHIEEKVHQHVQPLEDDDEGASLDVGADSVGDAADVASAVGSRSQSAVSVIVNDAMTERDMEDVEEVDRNGQEHEHVLHESQGMGAALQGFLTDIVSSVSPSGQSLYTSPHLTLEHDVDVGSILGKLEDLMVRHTIDFTKASSTLPYQTQLAMFLAQLTAVMSNPFLVPYERRKAVEKDLEPCVSHWLKELFDVPEDTKVVFHNTDGNIILDERVLHVALLKTLSNVEVGPEGQFPTPIIYHPDCFTSPVLEADLQRAWAAVGMALNLPSARLRSVPNVENGEAMDLAALETIMEKDVAAGGRPVLVVGRVGTPVAGQLDSLPTLRAICDKFNVWLHLEGPALSLLMLEQSTQTRDTQEGHTTPNATNIGGAAAAKLADSVTVDLGGWFGVNGLPIVSLVAAPTSSIPLIASHRADFRSHHTCIANSTTIRPGRISCKVKKNPRSGSERGADGTASLENTLPLWTTMQIVGRTGFRDVVQQALKMVEAFRDLVKKEPQLECFESGEPSRIALIRFSPTIHEIFDARSIAPYWKNEWMQKGTKYIFSRIPEGTKTSLGLELVCVAGTWFIRYDPIHAALPLPSHSAILPKTAQQIIMDAKRVQSCIDVDDIARSKLEAWNELVWFNDGDAEKGGKDAEDGEEGAEEDVWCGLGAVRYVPHYIDTTAGTISPEVLADLDGLNSRIAEELAQEFGDGSFAECKVGWFQPSLDGFQVETPPDTPDTPVEEPLMNGEVIETPAALEDNAVEKQLGRGVGGRDGVWKRAVAVRIGLQERPFTPEYLAEVVGRVVKKGQKLEKDEQFVASIEKVIRKGIEEAERQLRSESTDEQPSLLLSIPLLGSVLSWWRPSDQTSLKQPTAKSFDIATGFRAVPLGPNAPGTPRASISLRRGSWGSGSVRGSIGGWEDGRRSLVGSARGSVVGIEEDKKSVGDAGNIGVQSAGESEAVQESGTVDKKEEGNSAT